MKHKTLILTTLIVFLSFNLKGQEKTEIEAIHKVIVSSGIILQIEKTSEYSLSLTTQDLGPKCLIKEIENGVLTLKLFNGYGCIGKVTARLGCPSLPSMEIMGKAEVSTRKLFPGDSLMVKLQSGGQAYLDLDIKYLQVTATGGSTFYAEGYADEQDISVSTSASFSGYKLEGEDVKVRASVSGMAKVCAADKLEITAGSNTYVSYTCEPKEVKKDIKANAKVEVASEVE